MKIEYKGTTYDVKMRTKFNNYNCSVKMVGRLSIETEPKNENLVYEAEWGLKLNEHKKEIINEWLESLEDRGTYSPLEENNVMFPGDKGRYLPSVLLFADALNGYASTNWHQSFLALVREFQADPSYGVTVVTLPAYHNRTYGIYGAPRLSRVFALYPPKMKPMIFTPKNTQLRAEFKNKEIAKNYSGEDRKDYLAALG